jgi:hypothetical protein
MRLFGHQVSILIAAATCSHTSPPLVLVDHRHTSHQPPPPILTDRRPRPRNLEKSKKYNAAQDPLTRWVLIQNADLFEGYISWMLRFIYLIIWSSRQDVALFGDLGACEWTPPPF